MRDLTTEIDRVLCAAEEELAGDLRARHLFILTVYTHRLGQLRGAVLAGSSRDWTDAADQLHKALTFVRESLDLLTSMRVRDVAACRLLAPGSLGPLGMRLNLEIAEARNAVRLCRFALVGCSAH